MRGGKIYDFTDGYRDILRRRVIFVGEPAAAHREDYLRILRFFRFHARYGKGAPDAAGLAACMRLNGARRAVGRAHPAGNVQADGGAGRRADAEADGGAGILAASSSVYGGVAGAGAPAARPAAAACRAGARPAPLRTLAPLQRRGQAARGASARSCRPTPALAASASSGHPLPDRAPRPGATWCGSPGRVPERRWTMRLETCSAAGALGHPGVAGDGRAIWWRPA